MKKLLSILFICLIVAGCNVKGETPSKAVDNLFYNYKSLNKDVINQLTAVINEENITDAQKDKYKNIFIRQYKDLKYTIKGEKINGSNATVTVDIEVYNLTATKQAADAYLASNPNEFKDTSGNFDKNKFWNYKLDKLLSTTSRIKYTLDISLTKIDDSWRVDNLLDTELQKIHGVYQE